MTIEDLKPGMTCTILSQKKGMKYEGKVVIQKVKANYILTDAIRVNNQVVSFGGTTNSLVFSANLPVPQVFQYISPIIVRDGTGKTFYKIELRHSKSKEINRRKNARLKLNREVYVRADLNERTYTCNLKDMSATGFALVFTGRNVPKNHQRIKSFHFTYNDTDMHNAIKVSFNLTGKVRRCVVLNEKQVLFGCQIDYSHDIDKYVKTRIGKV